jgi:hypothetical protein
MKGVDSKAMLQFGHRSRLLTPESADLGLTGLAARVARRQIQEVLGPVERTLRVCYAESHPVATAAALRVSAAPAAVAATVGCPSPARPASPAPPGARGFG